MGRTDDGLPRLPADELRVCERAPLFDVTERVLSHAPSKLTDADLVARARRASGATTARPNGPNGCSPHWTAHE